MDDVPAGFLVDAHVAPPSPPSWSNVVVRRRMRTTTFESSKVHAPRSTSMSPLIMFLCTLLVVAFGTVPLACSSCLHAGRDSKDEPHLGGRLGSFAKELEVP